MAPKASERLEPRCQARVLRGYMAAFMNEVGQSFVALIDHPRLRVERLRASATLARVDGSTINCHWGLSARGRPRHTQKERTLGWAQNRVRDAKAL